MVENRMNRSLVSIPVSLYAGMTGDRLDGGTGLTSYDMAVDYIQQLDDHVGRIRAMMQWTTSRGSLARKIFTLSRFTQEDRVYSLDPP